MVALVVILMNPIISKINEKILSVYSEYCTVTRTDFRTYDVNLFGDWELDKAIRWCEILETNEFSTLSIERARESSTNVEYYVPMIVYSDGKMIVREYNYVD